LALPGEARETGAKVSTRWKKWYSKRPGKLFLYLQEQGLQIERFHHRWQQEGILFLIPYAWRQSALSVQAEPCTSSSFDNASIKKSAVD
jgi:hypothetical protein